MREMVTADDSGTEDGGEFALKTVFYNDIPLFKVSKTSIQWVDYPKELENQSRRGVDSVNDLPILVRMNRRMRNRFMNQYHFEK